MYIDCILTPKNKDKVTKGEIEGLFGELFDYNDNLIRIESRDLECKFRFPKNRKYCSVLISAEGDTREEAYILSKCKQLLMHNRRQKSYALTYGADESSLYYSIKSYKMLAEYERNLRYLTYLTMIHAHGNDWVEVSLKNNHNVTNEISKNDILNENTLEVFSLHLIGIYLFRSIPEIEIDKFTKSIEKILKNKNKNESDKLESVKELLNQYKGKSIWEKFFNYNELSYVEETFDDIRKYRNKVMHHHNIRWEEFDNKKKMIIHSKKLLRIAIEDIKNDNIEIKLIDINQSLENIGKLINNFNYYNNIKYLVSFAEGLNEYIKTPQYTVDMVNNISKAIQGIRFKEDLLINNLKNYSFNIASDVLEQIDIVGKYNIDDELDT